MYADTSFVILKTINFVHSAESLFNAVKKQYGVHCFLLPLQLPTSPLPDPVPVPALPPRLPRASGLDSPALRPQPNTNGLLNPGVVPPRPPASPVPGYQAPPPLANKDSPATAAPADYSGNTLRLTQDDIHQIGRFVREFVTMSLIPWMEKCVVDWNENVRVLCLG